jgi:DNA-binding transcriptional LysR family regulator
VFGELVFEACRQAGFVPRVSQEAGQLHALVGLVSAGVGITLLPQSMAAAPRQGVAYRSLTGKPPRLSIHLVWRDADLPPPAARFVEVARELLRE